MRNRKRIHAIRAIVSICAVLGSASILSATPTVQNYGPFEVTFCNAGDAVRLSTSTSFTGTQSWTAQQMADVAASIATWDVNIVNPQGRQIKMALLWRELDGYGTNVLGGSSSVNYGDGTRSWNYAEHVWRDGASLPTGPGTGLWGDWDTLIEYDVTAAGSSWNFGAGVPNSGQIDFRSVITHEIGHSLGFSPTLDYSSPGYYDDWGNAWGSQTSSWAWEGYMGLSAWDSFLVDSHGNRPDNGGLGAPLNFDQVHPVRFDGPNARAANGGADVAIYAPADYSGGSSLSHLDEATYPDALMGPMIADGQMVRELTAVEWAIMQDMGWQFVPGPTRLGDFNGDSTVNEADYTTWADNFGGSVIALADGSYNAALGGTITEAHYSAWADNFGKTYPAAIPEPATLSLLVLGGLAAIRRRKTTQA